MTRTQYQLSFLLSLLGQNTHNVGDHTVLIDLLYFDLCKPTILLIRDLEHRLQRISRELAPAHQPLPSHQHPEPLHQIRRGGFTVHHMLAHDEPSAGLEQAV